MPLLRPDGSEAISPTAHYTGFVWARNGLSPPDLATVEGRVLFESLRAPMAVSELLGGGTLEAYLLARHRAIDALLERAIDQRGVSQVIEVATGMSGRGLRFAQRYSDRLLYVETDLPAMARRKRRTLTRLDALSGHHRVEDLDALRDSGSRSLPELVRRLDHDGGLAIITEGLLGYLEFSAVRGCGDASRPCFAHSERGHTSRTSISARSRTCELRPSGWCWRRSCAGPCISTSAKTLRCWAL
jgi:O-methyltransferase involved in polyketide biosynthesis